MKAFATSKVLLIDGESWFAPPIANCLGAAGRRLHVLSAERRALVRFSRFCAEYHYRNGEADLLDAIRQIAAQARIGVIMACTDAGIRFLSERRKEIEDCATVAGTPDLPQIDIAGDKGTFAEFLAVTALPHPQSVVLRAGKPLLSRLPSFPILLKPARGFGGNRILRFNNAGDFEQAVRRNEFGSEDWVAQSFVPGRDIDISVLCRNGRILAHTVQCPLLPETSSFAPPPAIRFVHDDEVVEIARRLVSALNWTGVAHIDMRRDERDGKVFIIEMNGRYWASVYASLHAGVNFPELACLDASGEKVPYPNYADRKFVMFSAARRLASGGVRWTDTDLQYRLRDPGPFLANRLVHWFRKSGSTGPQQRTTAVAAPCRSESAAASLLRG
ncbi:MAG TPA: ATP-grasp domain-containing protein [Bryobacteraceae bacterium]|nr:ATP-grasp domain-containing protein [Bryobacteraceae bacterium]